VCASELLETTKMCTACKIGLSLLLVHWSVLAYTVKVCVCVCVCVCVLQSYLGLSVVLGTVTVVCT